MSETPARVTTAHPLREAIAEEIRAALGRRRMSASALARALDKSQTYVWRRLSGETAFDTDDLEAIAGILNVGVVDLLPMAIRSGSADRATYDDLASRAISTGPTGGHEDRTNVLIRSRDGSPVRPEPGRHPRRLAGSWRSIPDALTAAA